MTTKGRSQPKVYTTRPPCKWHGYPCHRSVEPGHTLCAWHKPQAAAKRKATIANRGEIAYDYRADPGCDCDACLRSVGL